MVLVFLPLQFLLVHLLLAQHSQGFEFNYL